MLRKMYLVSAGRFKQPSITSLSAAQPKSPSRRRRRKRDKNKRNVNTRRKSGLITVKTSARQISNARLRYRLLRSF